MSSPSSCKEHKPLPFNKFATNFPKGLGTNTEGSTNRTRGLEIHKEHREVALDLGAEWDETPL